MQHKNTKNIIFIILIGFILISFCSIQKSQAANQINITAYVIEKDGNALPDGDYDVRFSIYSKDRTETDPYPSNSDAGARVWQENQKISIYGGVMSAYLGAVNSFPDNLNFNSGDYYLGIQIGTDSEMAPRKKLGVVPSAINALNALDAATLQGKTTGIQAGNIPVLTNKSTLDPKILAKITQVGTISTGTWEGDVITDGYIASDLTGKTYNGVSLNGSNSLTVSTDVTLDQDLSKTSTPTFKGALLSPIAAPTVTANKLYNVSGSLYWDGIQIGVAGASQWTVSNSDIYYTTGNVGIGTTSPQSTLDVAGSMILSGAGNYINFSSTAGTSGYGLRDNSGTMQFKNSGGGWAAIGSDSSAAISGTAAAPGLFNTSDSTSGIYGNGSTALGLSVSGTRIFEANQPYIVTFYTYGNGTTPTLEMAYTYMTLHGADANQTNVLLESPFKYGNNSSNGSFVGTFSVPDNSYGTNLLTIGATRSTSEDQFSGQVIRPGFFSAIQFNRDGGPSSGSSAPGQILFETTPTGAVNPLTRMVIRSDGKVGIGTTSPLAMLDVAGSMILSGAGNYINFSNTAGSSGYGIRDNSGTIQFKNSGGSWAAIGSGGGGVTVDGSNNIYGGTNAFANNTTGFQNIALGLNALGNNTEGYVNNALGPYALYHNTYGTENNAFGDSALSSNTYGTENNAFGYDALYSNVDGNYNIGIGKAAGRNLTSGDNNIAIGVDTNFTNTTGSNQLNIGNTIYGDLDNGYIGIGTTELTGRLNIGPHTGVGDIFGINVDTQTTTAYGTAYGLYGSSQTTSYGTAYGLYGSSQTSSYGTAYGVYGNVTQNSFGTAYGGYFAASGSNSYGLVVASGNVGIGTTTPGGKLDVHGNGTTTGVTLQTADSAGLAKFTVLDSGNVGIGTTNPTSILEVSKNPALYGHGGQNITGISLSPTFDCGSDQSCGSNTIIATAINPTFRFNGGEESYTGLSINAVSNDTSAVGTLYGLKVNVTPASSIIGYSAIFTGGNVGIGTTSPNYKLDVAGVVNATGLKINGVDVGTSTDTYWNTATGGISYAAGNVGIGTTSPTSSSLLDMTSTSQGLLIPRMTTAQRNAIISPVTGLTIYNTDLTGFQHYTGTSWANISNDTSMSVQAVAGNKTLVAGVDSVYQWIPGDSTITLATAGATPGARFVIKESRIISGTGTLTIKQGSTTIDIMGTNAWREFVFDGSNWKILSNWSNTNSSSYQNMSIGYGAETRDGAIAIGPSASSMYGGIAIGASAQVSLWYDGIAIGTSSLSSDRGIAMGYNADGRNTTVAIGSEAGYGDNGSSARGEGNVFLGYRAGYDPNSVRNFKNKLIISNDALSVRTPLLYGEFDTGNVGIGTTSPGAMLDVRGSVNFGNGFVWDNTTNQLAIGVFGAGTASTPLNVKSNTAAALISINNYTVSPASTDYTSFSFRNIGTGGMTSERGAIRLYSDDPTNATFSSSMRFFTDVSGTVAERMRIDSAGNVGIGMTSPAYRLDIESSTAGVNILTTGATATGLNIHTDGASSAGLIIENGGASSTGLIVENGGASSYTATFNGGNVGIGTTSPGYKLDVQGGTGLAADKINSRWGYLTNGADYAEYFYTDDTDLQPGEVVCVDVTKDNAVQRCQRSGDNDVMGVVSTNPSVIGNSQNNRENDPNYKTIGMIGQVPGLVSTENGEIQIGDSLTSSEIRGYMRKAEAGESTVGVAMQNFDGTKGTIQILISRRNQSLTVEKVEQAVTQNIASMNLQDQVDNLISQAKANLDTQLANTNQSLKQIQDSLLQQNTEIAAVQAMQTKLQEQMNLMAEQAKVTADFIATLDVSNLLYKDALGNIDLGKGKITVKDVEAENVITQTLTLEDQKTSGKEIMLAGKSEIEIQTTEASKDVKIYITPADKLSGRNLYVDPDMIKEGESFTVKLDGDVLDKDVRFNWMIIK